MMLPNVRLFSGFVPHGVLMSMFSSGVLSASAAIVLPPIAMSAPANASKVAGATPQLNNFKFFHTCLF